MPEMKKTSGRVRKPEPRPSREAVLRDYAAGLLSLREVGVALGVSTARARRILEIYDVEIRQEHRRGKLAEIPVEELESAMEAKGTLAAARSFGVAPATLLREIRKRAT